MINTTRTKGFKVQKKNGSIVHMKVNGHLIHIRAIFPMTEHTDENIAKNIYMLYVDKQAIGHVLVDSTKTIKRIRLYGQDTSVAKDIYNRYIGTTLVEEEAE